ncbi:MAG: hypothetical protein DCC67_06735 [Planctomycetota bacterium]|nr:MAG: hypothetical protein DCC67_06735 [Planctomycetota bacterium]
MSTIAPPPKPLNPALVDSERYVDEHIRKARRSLKAVDLAAGLITLAIGLLGFVLTAAVIDHWVVPGGLNTAGRAALFAAFLAGIAWYAWKKLAPLARPINPVYAAQTIERSAPSLKNSLLNLLLFRAHRQELSARVYHAIEQQAALRLSATSADAAIDHAALLRLGYVLLIMVAACAAYAVLSPKDMAASAGRALAPWMDIAAPSRVKLFDVKPGDLSVARGEYVTVSAEIHGLRDEERVRLRLASSDGRLDDSIAMTAAAAGNRFEATLPRRVEGDGSDAGVLQDLHYWIEAGDARSRRYKVGVFDRPTIIVQKVRYEFPAYTGFPSKETDSTGDIRGIEGTKVVIAALASRPIKSAHVDFDADGTNDLQMTVDGVHATATFELALRDDRRMPQHPEYLLRFTTTEGRTNTDPPTYRIEVTPDYAPEIRITKPEEPERTAKVDEAVVIGVEARDPDFALANVKLVGRVGDGDEQVLAELFQGRHEGRFGVERPFTPAEARLKPGDVLEYWAVAADNKAPTANQAATERRRLKIAAPANQPQNGQPPQQGGEGRQDQRQQDGGGQGQQADGQPGAQGAGGGEQANEGEDPSGQGQGQPQANGGGQGEGTAQQQPGNETGENGAGGEGGEGSQQPADGGSNPAGNSGQQQPAGQNDGQRQDAGNANAADGQAAPSQQGAQPHDGQMQDGQMQSDPAAAGEQAGQPDGEPQQGQQREGQPSGQQRPANQSQQRQVGSGQQPGQPQNGQQPSQPGTDGQGKVSSDGSEDGSAMQRIADFLKGKQQDDRQSGEQPPGGSQAEANQNRQPADGNQENAQDGDPAGQPQGDNGASQQRDGAGQEVEQSGEGEGRPEERSSAAGHERPSQQDARPQAATAGQPREDASEAEQQSASGENPSERPGADTPRETNNGDGNPNDPQAAQQPSPDSGMNRDDGDAGSGHSTNEQQGSPASDEHFKQGRQKNDADNRRAMDDEEPPGGSPDKRESDSRGGKSGEQSGGGQAGAGQKADAAGKGDAGQHEAADEGGSRADEQGEGETANEAGRDQLAAGKTGKSSGDQAGAGSRQREADDFASPAANEQAAGQEKPDTGEPGAESGERKGEGGEPSGDQQTPGQETLDAPQNSGDGAAADGPRQQGQRDGASPPQQDRPPQGEPSDAAQSDQQSSSDASAAGRPSGGGPSGSGALSGAPETREGQSPDAANLEYARQQTDLVLERLDQQLAKKQVDKELLNSLGWTEQELRRFVDRWKNLKQRATSDQKDPGAQRELEAALRSLGLRPQGPTRFQAGASADEVRDLKEGVRKSAPLEYAERVRLFQKNIAEGQR